MAKKKSPAGWYWQSLARQREHERKAYAAKSEAAAENHMLRAANEEARRDNDKAYLHESIKLLRRFAHGFEAKDGYLLREVSSLTGRKLAKVKRLAGLIRQEQAQPHVEVIARNKAHRKTLISHTGQSDIPGRKRFIVFTDQPEKTTVKVVRRGKAKPRLEVSINVPGGVAREEFFHIADYLDGKPETFDDIKAALLKMLPDMPNGSYVLVTSNHGNIGVPAQKRNLARMIELDYMLYDVVGGDGTSKDNRGLAGVVVGFKLVSFTREGAQREYRERLTRRERLADARHAQREKQRRQRSSKRKR